MKNHYKTSIIKKHDARLEWEEGSSTAKDEHKDDKIMSMAIEMSKMSFKLARHGVDQSMSLVRKVIGYKNNYY